MDNKMQNINYNKYREWLNERKEKLKGGLGDNKPDTSFDKKQLDIGVEDETGEHTKSKQVGKEIAKDHLSADPDYYKKIKKAGIEEPKKKLSKYWKIRAKRRANRGGRGYPNKVDESWALEQQIKSESINNRINKLFEKELTVGEELSDNIDEYIKKIEEERASMFKMPKSFGKNKKPKGSISVALAPVYGGVAKGYRKKLNKLKKKGMVAIAPGEAFGPMQEGVLLDEAVLKDLFNKVKKFLQDSKIKIDTTIIKAISSGYSFFNDFSRQKINLKKNPSLFFEFLKKYKLLVAAVGLVIVYIFNGIPPPAYVVKMLFFAKNSNNINDFLNSNQTDIIASINQGELFTENKLNDD
jgi:hypothetical protein